MNDLVYILLIFSVFMNLVLIVVHFNNQKLYDKKQDENFLLFERIKKMKATAAAIYNSAKAIEKGL